MTARLAALVLVAALLGSAHSGGAAPGPVAPSARRAEVVPGELLVKFRSGPGHRGRAAAIASRGHAVADAVGDAGWVRVAAAPGQSVADAVAAYRGDPDVEVAQPNYVYRAAMVPIDTYYQQGLLWGLRNTGQTITNTVTQPPGSAIYYTTNNPGTSGSDMRLEAAWDHVTDCRSVVVAVLDTGVSLAHEDLAGNLWNGGTSNPNHGKNFVGTGASSNDATQDLNGHGTHVAGTIGAVGNNGKGTTGVCWSASLMAVRALDATGAGTSVTLYYGISFAVANGAKIVNMSLGESAGSDALLEGTISAAQASDVLFVVAAGNDGKSVDVAGQGVYPCVSTLPNVVCVTALDQAYQRASFSNYGATSVDLGAPGTNVVSTWAGTSGGGYDPLPDTNVNPNGGWSLSGGWNFPGTNSLVDPPGYGSGALYAKNADDRAYRTYGTTLKGTNVAVLNFSYAANVSAGDQFQVGWAPTTGDPFAAGAGTVFPEDTTTPTGVRTYVPESLDVSSCIGATGTSCTLGFRLKTGANASYGVAIKDFVIETLILNGTSYNTENGTSMATPAVTGVAALLRAYNPQFTFADVAGALKGGGRAVSSLAGITTTGKAVDAMGALAFVNPPTGLAAVIH